MKKQIKYENNPKIHKFKKNPNTIIGEKYEK